MITYLLLALLVFSLSPHDGDFLSFSLSEPVKAKTEKSVLPAQMISPSVPFTVQAPFTNWKEHKESCEEAALLMVHYFLQGKELSPKIANVEILKMKDWQKKNWGKEKDLMIEDLEKFAKEYLGYQKIKTYKKVTIKQIKEEMAKGNPVIVPMTAKKLKNPHYPHPGYHMLVAIGYKNGMIITNDPGTKFGKGWQYTEEIFQKGMEDYQAALVIYPHT